MNEEVKVHVHHNYSRNQIKEVLLQNSTKLDRPTPTVGGDKGLIYYDTEKDRVLVWDGTKWNILQFLTDSTYGNESVSIQDIWIESRDIINMSELTAKGTNGIVDFIFNLPLPQISGFEVSSPLFKNVISKNIYSDDTQLPTFFNVEITSSGNTVPRYDLVTGEENWRIVEKDVNGDITSLVRFFNDNIDISDIRVSFFSYIGQRLFINSTQNGNLTFKVYSQSDLEGNLTVNDGDVLLNETVQYEPYGTKTVDILVNGVQVNRGAYDFSGVDSYTALSLVPSGINGLSGSPGSLTVGSYLRFDTINGVEFRRIDSLSPLTYSGYDVPTFNSVGEMSLTIRPDNIAQKDDLVIWTGSEYCEIDKDDCISLQYLTEDPLAQQ